MTSVDVISRERIDRSGARDAAELLEEEPAPLDAGTITVPSTRSASTLPIATRGSTWADGVLQILIADGPPGSPEHRGSPVLSAWYDYDSSTHTVSPRAGVFAVRTADGHFAKLRVLAYEGGAYRIAIAFAGPGHDEL